MQKFAFTPRFIAAGGNREPNGIDWNEDINLIAYGAHNMVVLYNPHLEVTAAVAALRGSSQDVTGVRWIYSSEKGLPRSRPVVGDAIAELVSGSSDGDLRVWRITSDAELSEVGLINGSTKKPFSLAEGHPKVQAACSFVLRSPSRSPIMAVGCCRWRDLTFVAACTADGPVDIWARKDSSSERKLEATQQPVVVDAKEQCDPKCEWRHLQTITYPRYSLMHAVAMSVYYFDDDLKGDSISDSMLLLAIGGVDTKVRLLAVQKPPVFEEDGTTQFILTPLAALEGHLDWIRGIAFCDTRFGPYSTERGSSLLLATAAQDNHVRLTRIARPDDATLAGMEEFLGSDEQEAKTPREFGESFRVGSSLMEKGLFFVCGPGTSRLVRVAPEAALLGHEEWVCSVAWHPLVRRSDGGVWQPLSLLSSSVDKSMILWKPDTSLGSELWLSDVRVGESGGHTLGLFGACFGPTGDSIIGLGYTGCFHLWMAVSDDESSQAKPEADPSLGEIELALVQLYEASVKEHKAHAGHNPPQPFGLPTRRWVPKQASTGHNAEVRDIALRYDKEAPYVLSCSSDQTARVFAPLIAPVKTSAGNSNNFTKLPSFPAETVKASWMEIARPQVHGWNLVTIAMSPLRAHCYASCAEEKLIRVFDAPLPFIASLDALAGVRESMPGPCISPVQQLMGESDKLGDEGSSTFGPAPAPATKSSPEEQKLLTRDERVIAHFELNAEQRALSANQPELGLSNKAISEGDDYFAATSLFPKASEVDLGHVSATLHHGIKQTFVTRGPTEDELIAHSLWPEMDKLYGHGYDLVAIASTSGRLPYLVSAANARSAKNAALRVWDWRTLLQVQLLPGHQQTVVQIAFAPTSSKFCDKFFATVSKDQQVGLWRYVGPDIEPAELVASASQQRTESSATTTQEKTLFVLDDMQKAHTRQAFALCWSPGGNYIATTSRDRSLKLWQLNVTKEGPAKLVLVDGVEKLDSAITAIIAIPQPMIISCQDGSTDEADLDNDFILVCGCENGSLRTFQFDSKTRKLSSTGFIPESFWHCARVSKLVVAPIAHHPSVSSSASCMVFSASEDHSVRAFQLTPSQ